MSRISKVSREKAVKAFGSMWLVDDMGERLCEHLGTRKPALHFGDCFSDRDAAMAARPTYETVWLPETITLPTMTPVPQRGIVGGRTPIPRELHVVEFGNLLEEGLRVVTAPINRVQFEIAPPHLLGKVDFVACAVIAGDSNRYRILLEYDRDFGLNIAENPTVLSGTEYAATGQAMAFFSVESATREADRFAEGLRNAADWRTRSAASMPSVTETAQAAE